MGRSGRLRRPRHSGRSACAHWFRAAATTSRTSPARRRRSRRKTEHRLWYQYYFGTQRGHDGLAANRRDLALLLWRLWSPSWDFDEATFDQSAASFDNPDFVEVVIHSYRHRFGTVPGDPAVLAIEQALARRPAIAVPTIALHGADDGVGPPSSEDKHAALFTARYERRLIPGVGHNVPQEAPDAVVAALLDLLRT